MQWQAIYGDANTNTILWTIWWTVTSIPWMLVFQWWYLKHKICGCKILIHITLSEPNMEMQSVKIAIHWEITAIIKGYSAIFLGPLCTDAVWWIVIIYALNQCNESDHPVYFLGHIWLITPNGPLVLTSSLPDYNNCKTGSFHCQ